MHILEIRNTYSKGPIFEEDIWERTDAVIQGLVSVSCYTSIIQGTSVLAFAE